MPSVVGVLRSLYLSTFTTRSAPRVTLLARGVNLAMWLPSVLRAHAFFKWPLSLDALKREASKRANLSNWAERADGASEAVPFLGYVVFNNKKNPESRLSVESPCLSIPPLFK
jgi:hypothetical protein